MDLEAVLTIAREVLPAYFGAAPRPIAELRPADADFDRVFTEASRAAAKDAFGVLWAGAPNLPVPAAETTPVLNAARAEDFAAGGLRAKPFPNGYRAIADKLLPGVPWLVMRYVKPGQSTGLSFDGFVFLGERRFVWFPKPWKVIAPPTTEWHHWSD